MPRKPFNGQSAHLYDMLESAQRVRRYLAGVTFAEYWENGEKRDAIAMRIVTMGDAARHITLSTEALLPEIPFGNFRDMRTRLTHHYGKVDFREVWQVADQDIEPVVTALERYFEQHLADGNGSPA